MGKYLVKRLLHGVVSVVLVVAIVMIMIYSLLDERQVFVGDSTFTKTSLNARTAYMYSKWEEFGYLDYVTFADYMNDLTYSGEIDEETRAAAVSIGRTEEQDTELTHEYVEKFKDYYESQGYTTVRLNAVTQGKNSTRLAAGGQQQ